MIAKPALLLLTVLSAAASAQTTRRIQAVGTASITIKPDQARIIVGVRTSAATAQDAASQNSTLVDAVIKAVTQVIGGKGSLKTVNYSITADYRANNGQSQLVGYIVTNSIEVSVNDLSLIGPVIDAAVQAGANSVGSPTFTLQDPEPVRQQALSAAAKQARAHAEAIASGLGGKTGAVISAQEGASYTPLTANAAGATAGVSTPIQPGTLDISATVTLMVELQ